MNNNTANEIKTLTIKIEEGALLDAPVYESHSRGKNWFASISPNPTAPSGLDRKFHTKANGKYYYLIASVKQFEAIEFGGDYYTGTGKPKRSRFYGVVLSISETEIVFEVCQSASVAINRAKELKKQIRSEDDRLREKSLEDLLLICEEIAETSSNFISIHYVGEGGQPGSYKYVATFLSDDERLDLEKTGNYWWHQSPTRTGFGKTAREAVLEAILNLKGEGLQ